MSNLREASEKYCESDRAAFMAGAKFVLKSTESESKRQLRRLRKLLNASEKASVDGRTYEARLRAGARAGAYVTALDAIERIG